MRKIFALILVALILSPTAFAYSVPSDTIVYITPTGECYHREDCSYTSTKSPLKISKAESAGYWACAHCDPDILTSNSSYGQYLTPEEREARNSSKENSFWSVIGNAGEYLVYGIFGLLMLWMYAPIVAVLFEAAFDKIKEIFSKKN